MEGAQHVLQPVTPLFSFSLLRPCIFRKSQTVHHMEFNSRACRRIGARLRPTRVASLILAVCVACRYLRYARSKLCNVLTAAELQRRACAAGLAITTASVSPGIVATSIFDNLPGFWSALIRPLARRFYQTPRQVCTRLSSSMWCTVACICCLPAVWRGAAGKGMNVCCRGHVALWRFHAKITVLHYVCSSEKFGEFSVTYQAEEARLLA